MALATMSEYLGCAEGFLGLALFFLGVFALAGAGAGAASAIFRVFAVENVVKQLNLSDEQWIHNDFNSPLARQL
jgi:hypothetical protein